MLVISLLLIPWIHVGLNLDDLSGFLARRVLLEIKNDAVRLSVRESVDVGIHKERVRGSERMAQSVTVAKVIGCQTDDRRVVPNIRKI